MLTVSFVAIAIAMSIRFLLMFPLDRKPDR